MLKLTPSNSMVCLVRLLSHLTAFNHFHRPSQYHYETVTRYGMGMKVSFLPILPSNLWHMPISTLLISFC